MSELDKLLNEALGLDKLEEPDFGPVPKPLDNRPVSDLQRELEQESFGWAADVYWVYRHLGEKPSKVVAGGLNGRYQLWKHARASTQKFIEQMLPKAMLLLEKAKAKQDDGVDAIMEEEGKSIRKLQRILKAAILEAEQLKV